MLNKTIFTGNAATDVSAIREARNSTVSDVILIWNDSWIDDNGARHERSVPVKVEFWNGKAKYASKITKGRRVTIEGQLQAPEAYLKDGKPTAINVIRCEELHYL